ncbi:MAG TPA: nitroreductase family protein [Syntrophales bacterium]|nr:nitroreductase family protein [Syntrophales bacterium]
MRRKITAGLMIGAFLVLFAGTAAVGEPISNDTLKTIFSRKSVRSYKDVAVPKEKIEMLVRAGMAAPTAVDKRPWEFIVITDKKLLSRLADALPYAQMAKQAAAGIVVAGDTKKQWGGRDSIYWIMDCSAASENILLAAESMALGAVWTAIYPEEGRAEAVRNILGLPGHIIPLNFIPIGVPQGTEKPKDKYNPAQIHWNKW